MGTKQEALNGKLCPLCLQQNGGGGFELKFFSTRKLDNVTELHDSSI